MVCLAAGRIGDTRGRGPEEMRTIARQVRFRRLAAVLDAVCARDFEAVQKLFGRARAESFIAMLEQISASMTELAYSIGPTRPPESAATPPPRCAQLLAEALRPHLADSNEKQLRMLCEMMVWTADGVLEGAMRRPEVSTHDASRGLFAAWKGMVSGLVSVR